jgi:hypothetical protein
MKSDREALRYVLCSNDVGSSSEALIRRAYGFPADGRWDTPSDGDDFGRCIRAVRALEINPEVMRDANPEWNDILDRWADLVAAYDGRKNAWSPVTNLLREIRDNDAQRPQTNHRRGAHLRHRTAP